MYIPCVCDSNLPPPWSASGHQVSELLLKVAAVSATIPAFGGGGGGEAALKERLPSERYNLLYDSADDPINAVSHR